MVDWPGFMEPLVIWEEEKEQCDGWNEFVNLALYFNTRIHIEYLTLNTQHSFGADRKRFQDLVEVL